MDDGGHGGVIGESFGLSELVCVFGGRGESVILVLRLARNDRSVVTHKLC